MPVLTIQAPMLNGPLPLLRGLFIALVIIGIAGAAFSGTLTWREYSKSEISCTPVGSPGTILGYPPCVYGLVMYIVVIGLAAWGLIRIP